jgi:hypothetical protein
MVETNFCQDVLWDARIGSGSPLQLIRLLSKTELTGSSPSACDTASRQSDVINCSPVRCIATRDRRTVMNFYRCTYDIVIVTSSLEDDIFDALATSICSTMQWGGSASAF